MDREPTLFVLIWQDKYLGFVWMQEFNYNVTTKIRIFVTLFDGGKEKPSFIPVFVLVSIN